MSVPAPQGRGKKQALPGDRARQSETAWCLPYKLQPTPLGGVALEPRGEPWALVSPRHEEWARRWEQERACGCRVISPMQPAPSLPSRESRDVGQQHSASILGINSESVTAFPAAQAFGLPCAQRGLASRAALPKLSLANHTLQPSQPEPRSHCQPLQHNCSARSSHMKTGGRPARTAKETGCTWGINLLRSKRKFEGTEGIG